MSATLDEDGTTELKAKNAISRTDPIGVLPILLY